MEPVTEDEVARAIGTSKPGKTCGPDRLGNDFYRDFSTCLVPILTFLYNAWYRDGVMPTSFLLREVDSDFSTGETVVYRLKAKQFGKESAKWSTLVYEVAGMDGYRIQIRSKNGHILYKSPNDLKRVKLAITNTDASPGQIFEAESILKHKKMRNNKYKYFIKWKGYDDPSWESQDNLRLINKNEMSTLEKQYWRSDSQIQL